MSSSISQLDWLSGLQSLSTTSSDQRHAVLVTITAALGSTPRGTGTRMLVTPTTQYGTIGGGHLEWKALAMARLWLSETLFKTSSPRTEKLALGPSLGQCCGGAVQIQFDRLDQWSDAEFTTQLSHFQQQQPMLPQLILFGAGHVGAALVQVLSQIPCRILWVDERDHLFPAQLPANVQTEATDTPEAVIAHAETSTYFLVMTHHHGLDLRLSEQILKRGDAAWFGLIGSQTKRAGFEHRLKERGIPVLALQSMICPIGLPGITGKEPGVIAVAVAAQLLQLWSTIPALPANPVLTINAARNSVTNAVINAVANSVTNIPTNPSSILSTATL